VYANPGKSRWRSSLLAAALTAAVVLGAAGATGLESPPLAYHPWPLLLAAAVFLALSASLSAAEASLFSLGSEQIESLERQSRRGILAAKALLTFRDETLVTLLLANYVANLALIACLLLAFSRAVPEHPILWASLGGVFSAVAIVVLGEFLPRAIGHCFNEAVAMSLARPLVGLTSVVAPLRWFVLMVSSSILGRPGESPLERELGSEEEFKTLITGSDLSGGLEEDERELITSVVEFGSTCVGEIMTPRSRLFALPDDTPHGEILQQMRRCKFSRVLVYQESLDQIRGLLHVKEVLLNPATDYHELLRKPLVVPERKGLMDLLREFRRRRLHLAVVCDEFGRTAGVVTMQDLLEQIVGEMTDEGHRAPEPIRRIGPSAWLVLGRADVAELREQVGLDLSQETGRTVSGFVATRLGRIPEVGDSIAESGFVLTVERMAVRRVAILRIKQIRDGTTNGTAEEPS
jgi:CBS domain containing-hemolysin-like protein